MLYETNETKQYVSFIAYDVSGLMGTKPYNKHRERYSVGRLISWKNRPVYQQKKLLSVGGNPDWYSNWNAKLWSISILTILFKGMCF